jgi:hypothetical protein
MLQGIGQVLDGFQELVRMERFLEHPTAPKQRGQSVVGTGSDIHNSDPFGKREE